MSLSLQEADRRRGQYGPANGQLVVINVEGRILLCQIYSDCQNHVVSAKGQGVDIATLKAGVSSLDLGKLESMKNLGVSK